MRTMGVLFGVCIAVGIIIGLLALGVVSQARSTSVRFQELALQNCKAIEALKAVQRAEAIESFDNLDETLRLLMLERTAEIVAVARRQRDTKLERFRAREC